MGRPGAPARAGSRKLDWGAGGFVLAAAGVLVLAIVALRLPGILRSLGAERGAEPWNGFELTPLLVARETLVTTGLPRDGIRSLDDPPLMEAAEVEALNREVRGKYLVPGDLVLGVVVEGAARAYPLRVLDWHEVVNDRLGGRPIAVTWHALSGAAVVFDRRAGGETLVFGVSGLVWQSNLLLYDRVAEPATSSLWSQLDARAIAGPAAARGATLTTLPCSLARWSDWIARHPTSTVLRPAPERIPRYEADAYGVYRMGGRPRFPVEPEPPAGGPPAMTRLLVLDDGDARRLVPLDRPGAQSPLPPAPAPAGIEFLRGEETTSVLVEPREDLRVRYAYWFAWHALHADEPVPN